MISNGLDPAGEIDKLNGPAEDAIDEAIRAGISVSAMYHPSADYTTADWSKRCAGQIELAHVPRKREEKLIFSAPDRYRRLRLSSKT
jgi:hypothetical protein